MSEIKERFEVLRKEREIKNRPFILFTVDIPGRESEKLDESAFVVSNSYLEGLMLSHYFLPHLKRIKSLTKTTVSQLYVTDYIASDKEQAEWCRSSIFKPAKHTSRDLWSYISSIEEINSIEEDPEIIAAKILLLIENHSILNVLQEAGDNFLFFKRDGKIVKITINKKSKTATWTVRSSTPMEEGSFSFKEGDLILI